MTRSLCGSLGLHRAALSSAPPRRFIPVRVEQSQGCTRSIDRSTGRQGIEPRNVRKSECRRSSSISSLESRNRFGSFCGTSARRRCSQGVTSECYGLTTIGHRKVVREIRSRLTVLLNGFVRLNRKELEAGKSVLGDHMLLGIMPIRHGR